MRPDPDRWEAAGGSRERLALYGTLGEVAPFARGSDRCLASIHPAAPTVGAVGDWSGGNAVRAAAEDWLRARGCTVARGPLELCTWFRYRASLGPSDEPPFALEPTEPAARWEAVGYAAVSHYASALADHRRQVASAAARATALSAAGWAVEPLRAGPDGAVSVGDFADAVQIVHRISSAAFTGAFGYVPVPLAALHAWYAPYRAHVDPRLTLLARALDGHIAGFVFALPDLAAPARGWFLVKTLAVEPRYRALGVGSWLVAEAHRAAAAAGFRAGVHCLMWTGSHSNAISRHGATVFRRYALLEKPL